MSHGLRRTGIDLVGSTPWGTHFCQFFRTKEDLLDILVPYFASGLEDNEFCVWVTSEPLVTEEAREALRRVVADFDRYEAEGRIEILPYTEWYLKDGVFSAERVLKGWVDKLNSALTAGYDGLRLTGNTFWLEKSDWQAFVEYETLVDGVIGNCRMLGLCTYSLDKCGASEIIDTVRNHEFALIRREGEWELIQSHRRAEAEIRRSQLLLDSIVQNLPVQIFVKDAQDLKYVLLNRSCEPLTGYPAEAFLGKTDYDFFPREQADFFVSKDREALAKGALVDIPEEVLESKSGDRRILHTKKVPIIDESGKPRYLLGISEDITEQKSLQRQLLEAQKMAAIGTLAGGMAHDFNNILQVVLGYSELILDEEDLPERYRADLRRISGSARQGADLIQRLLTFSRKKEIRPQPLNLNRHITEMRHVLERTIPNMIHIELIPDKEPAVIKADPTQVDQVLINLAVNARDAMPEGGSLVFETANVILDAEYAKAHPDVRPGHYVLLTVTDTGRGMDRDTLEHIFEPFYTTKGVGEGTGLGLAMVYGIVHQHGGHIRCDSEPGRGTTFKIWFPALVEEEAFKDSAVSAIRRGESETILLVDDEELIRDFCCRVFTKAGYRVITARNGATALEVYRQRGNEIALVVLDLIMPQVGGKQCLEELLCLNPSVKVIIASGYSTDGPTKDALAAGAKGFVKKPYNARQVLEVVRRVLDGG
ncbi:MAG: MEDS domain-containing protein [Thermodesulfobacteriota bacterium]